MITHWHLRSSVVKTCKNWKLVRLSDGKLVNRECPITYREKVSANYPIRPATDCWVRYKLKKCWLFIAKRVNKIHGLSGYRFLEVVKSLNIVCLPSGIQIKYQQPRPNWWQFLKKDGWLHIYMNVFFVWHGNKAFITDGKIRGFPFFLETPKRPSLWVAKSGGFPPKNMGNMFHKHPRGEIIIIENKRSFPSRNDQNLNHSQEEANFFEESPP